MTAVQQYDSSVKAAPGVRAVSEPSKVVHSVQHPKIAGICSKPGEGSPSTKMSAVGRSLPDLTINVSPGVCNSPRCWQSEGVCCPACLYGKLGGWFMTLVGRISDRCPTKEIAQNISHPASNGPCFVAYDTAK